MDDKKICFIDISNLDLEENFTFYESGKIKHFYDKSRFNPSLKKWYPNGSKIPDHKKAKLLEKCPKEYLTRIKIILSHC